MKSTKSLAVLVQLTRFAFITAASAFDLSCRSNATHITWNSRLGNDETHETDLARQLTLVFKKGKPSSCLFQTREHAEQDALNYLRQNVMAFDKYQLETLGFGGDEDDGADGLSNGLVGPTVELAINAKILYEWTDSLPQQLFYEYVLNYANLNEARTNWRPLLTNSIMPLLEAASPSNISQVVRVLNTHMWSTLAHGGSNSTIEFRPSQTPLIFDPMSVIAFGYASCTGLAILFVNALRAAGVAARVAGTPAWKGKRQSGNHNWVEVFDGRTWKFLEPSAGQADVDNLERDPCKRWFCIPDRYPASLVYAARLDQVLAKNTFFRLAWEWNSTDVPGLDRTEYYADACNKCNFQQYDRVETKY